MTREHAVGVGGAQLSKSTKAGAASSVLIAVPGSLGQPPYVTNNPLGLIDPAGLCGVTTIFYQLSHDDQGKPNGIIFLGSNFVETYPGPCFAPCRYDPSATANGGLLCGMTLYMPTYSSNGPAANTGGIDLGALHGFPISIVSLNAVRNSMQCADKTIQNNKVALGQDALGFIPGEGLVHSLFGIAMGAVSSVTAAMNGDKAGAMLGVAGMHVSALEGVSKVVPVAGQLINVVATGHDVNRTGSDFNSCMSGNGGG